MNPVSEIYGLVRLLRHYGKKRDNKMKIKGAIFDMDGTLVNSLTFWEYAWPIFGEKYLGNKDFYPSAEDDKAIRTMTMLLCWEHMIKQYGFPKSAQELTNETNNLCEKYYKEVVDVKDGTFEFLEYLKSKGIRMCVASATAKYLVEMVVKHFGLDKYIEKVISCADIGKGKDCPDVFIAAAEYLGADISETCVFEDSALAVKTAKTAGFNTVGIYDKYNYDHDILKANSDIYIADGETIMKAAESIE